MISASDLRTGMVIELDGRLYQVVSAEHFKPGKGIAFMRTRIKDIETSSITDYRFRTGEKVNRIKLDDKKSTYLYKDGDNYIFMDNETYEHVYLKGDDLGETINFLVENESVTITFYEGNPISIDTPIFVELEVIEAKPGVKGDTASGGSKPVKVITGYTLSVPLFIEQGDVIKIDTRTGKYVERVK